MQARYTQSKSDLKRARTRTLIQIGGLIEKSGFLEKIGIQLGDDLQNDETLFDKASILLGAVYELNSEIRDHEQQLNIWRDKGKKLITTS
ncbi:MAG: conjugal transfer protein TraD [Alphaproteobacteria bacterium]|nr:conjugal transfer protein TraD [Alphaproteobacteria bacterium]